MRNCRRPDGCTGLAERFDGKFADMFALEGEISARIVREVERELVNAEVRNGPDRAGDLNIHDLVTCGYADLTDHARRTTSRRHATSSSVPYASTTAMPKR